MKNISEGIAPVPARSAGRPGRAVLALALAALGLAACEGDNLFEGQGPSFDPRILQISAPDLAFAGDSISVRVEASAARRVEQIIISARGAASLDTVVTVDQPRQQIAQVVRIGIPAIVQDTLLRITASVIDAAGVQSDQRQLLVPAAGPPIVQNVGGPSGVRPGDLINLRVRAFGTRPISRIDIAARGAVNKDTVVTVSPARISVEQDVAFRIPSAVQDTLITFTVSAQDQSGVNSGVRTALVPFAIDTPSVSLIAPPTVQAGKILNLGIAAQSLRQITQIRVELRSGLVRDIVIPIAPTRASTVEYVSVELPDELTVPSIQVRAFAMDKGNALSATGIQIVNVPNNVPQIVSVDPFNSTVPAGHFVDVRVTAQGDRAIKELRVRWRGFDAKTLLEVQGGPDQIMVINPPNNLVTRDIAVETPCVVDGGTLLMLVTARDLDDRLSAVVTQSITLSPNDACAPPDTTTPTPRMPRPRLPGIGDVGSEPLSFGPAAADPFRPEPFTSAPRRAARRGRRAGARVR